MTTPIDIILEFKKTGQGDSQATQSLKELGKSGERASLELAALKAQTGDINKKMRDLAQAVAQGKKSFDEAEKELTEYKNALIKLPEATQKVEASVEKMGTKTQTVGDKFNTFKTGLAAASVAIVAVGAAAKQAYEFISEGAALDAARTKFENLTVSIGTTSDAMLGDLRAATKGMVSDAELMASASQIISLGLSDTQDGVTRLATVISALGLDMQQVILTFANNSTARLDALGLSITDVKTKAAELEAQGFKGDSFDEAVLIALEQKMVLLGDASETTAGQIQILESNWENFTDSLKEGAAGAEIVSSSVKGLNRDLDIREQLLASSAALEEFGYSGVSLQKALGALGEGTIFWRNSLVDAETLATRTAIAVDLLSKGFQGGAKELAALVAAQEQSIARSEEAANYYQAQALAASQLEESTSGVSDEILAAAAAASSYDTALLQNYATTQQLNNANRELVTSFDSLNNSAGGYFEQAINGDLTQGNLNQKLFDSAAAAGASATELALLGGALGLYSEEAVESALKTAIIQAEIDRLAASYAAGELTVGQMTAQLRTFIAGLDEIGGEANYAGEQIIGLTDKISALPTQHDFVIKITQDGEIPTLPSGPSNAQAAAAFAEGGLITGGTAVTGYGQDNVMIAATTGEYVLKPSAVRKLGLSRLNQMNSTGRLPGFADGGYIGDDSTTSTAGASVMFAPVIHVSGVVDRQQAVATGQNVLDGLTQAARARGVRI